MNLFPAKCKLLANVRITVKILGEEFSEIVAWKAEEYHALYAAIVDAPLGETVKVDIGRSQIQIRKMPRVRKAA